MSDHTLHPEFDDELLSAYLDDELSAEERARVEGRLAADPGARALLEQLRAVSQSVRELPAEKLGGDLREAVLARAEQVMLSSPGAYPRIADEPETSNTASQLTGGSLPPFSFGRTRRGWFWAGLAVAAALLVAFVQPDEEGQKVAQRADKDREPVRLGEVEMRALEPAAPAPVAESLATGASPEAATAGAHVGAPMDAAAAPPAESLARTNLRGARGAAPPEVSAPSSAPLMAPAPRSGATADRLDVGADDTTVEQGAPVSLSVRNGAMRGGVGGEPSAARVAAPVEENVPVIVRVNATPTAFKNKSFDQVLLNNGIAVEEDLGEVTGQARNAQLRDPIAERDSSEEESVITPEMEVVLVEAPSAQIEACLTTLNNDAKNYLAVEVEGLAPDESDRSKKLAYDLKWGQYNRGAVPQQQKAQFAPGADWYYYRSPDGGGEVGGTEPIADQKAEAIRSFGMAEGSQSRARRLQPPINRDLDGSPHAPVASGMESLRESASGEGALGREMLGRGLREAKSLAAATGDQLQVLFVISPDTAPAASPAATSSPQ